MTENRLKLPSYFLVQSWEKQQVLNWLRNCQLDDCIPAFESREIDGPALLELSEEKLFTFQDVKIKRRVQLTKCVNECKSQAMQAKEFVNSMRKPPQRKIKSTRNLQVTADEQENDFDCWDDFDDDDDEEEEDEHELQQNNELPGKSNSLGFNNPSNPEESLHNNEFCRNEAPISELNSGSEQYADSMQSDNSLPADVIDINISKKLEPTVTAINKTLDKPSLPKPPPTLLSGKNYQRVHIPRSVPLKRPPSQPPPPPVPHFQRPVSIQEDYEIPINSSLVVTPVVPTVSQASLPQSSILNKPPPQPPAEESQETYEVVQPPEETYEIVSEPTFKSNSPIPIRPTIPPRVNGSQVTDPPPLPEKPKKLQEISTVPVSSSKKDCSAFADRRLSQKKIYDKTLSSSPISSGILAGLLSNLRDAKQGSPNSCTKLEQCNSDSLTLSSSSSSIGQSSKVSTLERNVAEVSPGSSLHSSKDKLITQVDGSNQPEIPSLPSGDDGGVLNRPLPPVPPRIPRNIPLPENPWFHDISREAAEETILKMSQDGAYLVRPSKRAGQENPYTLTIFHDAKLFHLNIRLRSDGMYSLGKEKPREKTFASVADLITFHQKEPILLTSKGEPAGRATLCVTVLK